MKKRIIGLVLVLAMVMCSTGCFAGLKNNIAKNGGFFTKNAGDYVVINYAGNKIMDVYKLKNCFVQSEGSSDGWNLIDDKGNVVLLAGDEKIIRVNDASTFDNYKEYHYEFDGGDYYDFLKANK